MSDQKVTNSYYDFSGSTLTVQSILDVFVLQDLITQSDADDLKKRLKTNRKIEDFLVKNRIVSKDTVNKAYSIILKLPYIEIKNIILPTEIKKIIPEKLVRQYGIVPFDYKDGIMKIAISRPADLLVSYRDNLGKIFTEKNLEIELFITGESDYLELLKQYNKRYKSGSANGEQSMPVVYLRSQKIGAQYLSKIPQDFVAKYRIVVFGANQRGYYQVACEQPDSVMTKKILDFIQSENDIKFEIFKTSKEDIDFVINSLGNKNNTAEKPSVATKEERSRQENSVPTEPGKSFISSLLDGFNKSNEPEFTIDTVERAGRPVDAKKDSIDVVERESIIVPENVSGLEVGTLTNRSDVPVTAKKQEENMAPAIVKAEPGSTETQKAAIPASASLSESKNDYDSKNLGSYIDKEIKTEADLVEAIRSNSVPKIVAAVLDFALNNRSSDIHVEPEAKVLRVRCRIDGILRDVAKLDFSIHAPFVSRVKIMSRLKIDETRIPQDGRFDTVFKDREVDVRVSTLPTIHGEKVVMRILDKSQGILSLEDLGMQGSAFEKTMEALKKPYGIILSTGPTGSGKSTTLYAVLNRISVPGVNIVTLEDPVEYDIPGINQCQIKPDIGFTFASGLRSILRQDPNVIMVGEIRDAETAGMAVHSALTGHLVLSTLHTNDTAGTLPRLIDMGVEPFLVTSSINLILAQRLVRRICPKCKEELKVPQRLVDQIVEEINKIPASNAKDRAIIPPELKLYHGKGCSECNQGFKGRIGIYEVMTMSQQIEDMAIAKKTANELKDASVKEGMITMKQDGIIKALMGLTTIDEVFQAVVNN